MSFFSTTIKLLMFVIKISEKNKKTKQNYNTNLITFLGVFETPKFPYYKRIKKTNGSKRYKIEEDCYE